MLLAHWTALGLIDAVRLAATAAIRESSAASRPRRNTCLIAMDWLADWWTHEVLRSSGPLIWQHALSLLLAAHDSPDNQARDDVHARDVAVLDALVQLQTSYIRPSFQEDSFMWLVNIAIYGAETEAELVANTSGTTVVTSAQIAQASLAAPRVIVKALSLMQMLTDNEPGIRLWWQRTLAASRRENTSLDYMRLWDKWKTKLQSMEDSSSRALKHLAAHGTAPPASAVQMTTSGGRIQRARKPTRRLVDEPSTLMTNAIPPQSGPVDAHASDTIASSEPDSDNERIAESATASSPKAVAAAKNGPGNAHAWDKAHGSDSDSDKALAASSKSKPSGALAPDNYDGSDSDPDERRADERSSETPGKREVAGQSGGKGKARASNARAGRTAHAVNDAAKKLSRTSDNRDGSDPDSNGRRADARLSETFDEHEVVERVGDKRKTRASNARASRAAHAGSGAARGPSEDVAAVASVFFSSAAKILSTATSTSSQGPDTL